jgi:phosphoglycerate dehydrogenase-like enzyme
MTVAYPITPKTIVIDRPENLFKNADVVITHLGKEDFPRYWLDQYLPYFKQRALYISTTRGPLYHATALNTAVRKNEITAVLDWAWEEDKLIEHERIIHTGHSSYRSEHSGIELAQEVIRSVEVMRKELSK